MSGHNKWSQIKRQKGAVDGAKSRLFSRLSKLITIESKKALGNTTSPTLLSVIQKAKEANMPKDSIERAVAKGVSKDSGSLDSLIYELYGPEGVAIVVTALTDNKNRTTQEIKHLLSKNGYELGAPGSALWAFTKFPSGTFSPNEPLVNVENENALTKLLELIDTHEDTQTIATNACGFESTDE